MPNIRIKDIPTTASATVNGDFFAVDSNASTRKLDAFNPTFGGRITASGTGTNVFRGPIRIGNTTYPGYNGYISESNTDSQLNASFARNLIGSTGATYTIANGELSSYSGFEIGTDIRWFAASGVFTTGQSVTPSELMRLKQGGNLLVGTSTDSGHRIQAAGNISATGTVFARLANTLLYEAQVYAANSSPSGTNGALSQAIFLSQPGYTTYIGTTGDGTVASYRVNSLGNVVQDQQGYLISDAARGLLIHSINGPTIFATQNSGSEKMRLQGNGTLLLKSDGVDGNNGRLQLATHTASSGGIGFGTDTSLYRAAAGALMLTDGTVTGLFWARTANSALEIGPQSNHSLILRTNNTVALTLDTSQNATFSKDVVLGFNGPSVPSTLSGRAPRQGLVFDGTAGTYAGATISALRTSPLTYEAVFRVPLAAGTGQGIMFVGNSPTSVGGNSGAVYIQSSGELRVIFRTDNSNYVIADLSSFVSNNAGKLVHFALVRPSSGDPSIYINGVAQSPVFSSGGSPVGGWQMDLIGTNAVFNTIDGSATAGTTILSPRIYNRALSAAEVKALYENGVPAASDYNTAGTTINTANFGNLDGGSTLTGNSATGVTVSRAVGASYIGVNAGGKSPRPGQRFRLTGTLTLNAGKVAIPSAYVDGTVATLVPLTVGAFSIEVVTGPNGGTTAGVVLSATGDQNWTISNFLAISLGAVLAPDATQTGGGLTWYDTSGNGANITLPASGVSWNVPFAGSITSGTAVNLRAGGTNQDVIARPTGAGRLRVAQSIVAPTYTNNYGLTINDANDTRNVSLGVATNYSFLQSFNSVPLAINPGGNVVLIGKEVNSSNGFLQLVESTSNTSGIGFGTDVNLYRSAANTLRTDDVFQSAAGIASGSYVGGTELYLNNAAGTVRAVYWQTAGVSRWAMYANNTAEGGGNAGSNLTLSRYSDAGAYLGDAFSSDRASGNSVFGSSVGIGGISPSSRLHVYENTSGTGDSNGITIEQAGTADAALQLLLTGVQRWTVGVDNSDSDKFKIGAGAVGSADRLTLDTTGNATLAGSITTSAPTGGAGAWKLGIANTVTPTAPNRTLTVEIGGTIYYIHAKTTNN